MFVLLSRSAGKGRVCYVRFLSRSAGNGRVCDVRSPGIRQTVACLGGVGLVTVGYTIFVFLES